MFYSYQWQLFGMQSIFWYDQRGEKWLLPSSALKDLVQDEKDKTPWF